MRKLPACASRWWSTADPRSRSARCRSRGSRAIPRGSSRRCSTSTRGSPTAATACSTCSAGCKARPGSPTWWSRSSAIPPGPAAFRSASRSSSAPSRISGFPRATAPTRACAAKCRCATATRSAWATTCIPPCRRTRRARSATRISTCLPGLSAFPSWARSPPGTAWESSRRTSRTRGSTRGGSRSPRIGSWSSSRPTTASGSPTRSRSRGRTVPTGPPATPWRRWASSPGAAWTTC